jgi:hypothetical protein
VHEHFGGRRADPQGGGERGDGVRVWRGQ